MKVTDEMVKRASAASGLGINVDSTIRCMLEAALADVPDIEEAVRAVAALWSGRVQAAEAKLSKVRDIAHTDLPLEWERRILEVIDGD